MDRKKLSRLEDLPLHIQDIVEDNLNRDDYWIHRNGLFQADISHDYVEFKKEKNTEGSDVKHSNDPWLCCRNFHRPER
ncbi:hypothetical protein [Methanosarcina horonobensis]|uniref:hypothetical protein n=1 Tax=Methanosarcina horonobensis TaxID=418008 RepID=UPI000AFCDA50|nr:hypothetical protein [Methanosarcina horonobensis]